MKKILLVGNPNVGKSAIFSRLTNIHVIAANYPGTTVEYSKGYLRLSGEKKEVIDVHIKKSRAALGFTQRPRQKCECGYIHKTTLLKYLR